jgi:hypothetical protein
MGTKSSNLNAFNVLAIDSSIADRVLQVRVAFGARVVIHAVVGLMVVPAYAQEKAWVLTCVDASDRGQVLRDKGNLREARVAFAKCGAKQCPAEIAADCGAWLQETEARMPSVVVVVRDAMAKDVDDARIAIDGVDVGEKTAQGRSVELDPGRHVARASGAWGHVDLPFVLREREKGRQIAIVLPSQSPERQSSAGQPSAGRPVPMSTFVFGGAAVVFAGLGIGFGASSLAQYSDLKATCPSCSDASRDAVRYHTVVADVSLGLGVVSAALATILYLTRPEVPKRMATVGPLAF